MDDALLVRGFERVGNLSARSASASSSGIGAARDALRQVLALDELHHEGRDAVGLSLDAVDLRDVRMVERRERLRFALEARRRSASRANASAGP